VKEEWRGMRNGPWFARPVDTEREREREKEITASDFPPHPPPPLHKTAAESGGGKSKRDRRATGKIPFLNMCETFNMYGCKNVLFFMFSGSSCCMYISKY